MKDLSLGKTTKGAFLDPAEALPLFLKLAYEGDFVPRTVTVLRLALFFDANELYGRDKCQLILFSLPDARSPHQLGPQLPIARYLGRDDHITTFAVKTECDLITALEVVWQTGWTGGLMELRITLDWQVLRIFANVPPPTAQMCCVECWGVKDDFRFPTHVRQLLRDFLGCPSKLLPIIRLIKRRENSSYEPEHADNHALANGIVHHLHIWCAKNLPGSYCFRLREIFARHFNCCPYYPRKTEACGKNSWSPANNLTKETIYNNKSWTDIQTLLRQVVVRNGAEVSHDPFAKLMVQIISWHPTEIERRDDMAPEAHMLHHKIGLSKKRFGVVVHYFFEHFTERLKHHGSLMRNACEGGEHLHQAHAAVVRRRPSRSRWKCPVGLCEVMKKERLRLALWRQKWVVPAFWSSKPWCRTLLKKCRVKGYLSLPCVPKHILQTETRSHTPNPPTYIRTRTHADMHTHKHRQKRLHTENEILSE